MNKYDYKEIRPFCRFVLENFPFIEYDFDALTPWKMWCALGDEINKIINSQNEVGEEVEKLSIAFNALQEYVNNYFETLDVQNEIDNKLDEMAENGQLTEIIAQFLEVSSYLVFDTIDELKNADNIVIGSKLQTLGFYSKNDEGKGTYIVREITNEDIVDNITIITLTNYTDLIAELQIEDTMSAVTFGADKTGTNDSTVNIQKAIDKNINVYFPKGTYLISQITLKSNRKYFGILPLATIIKSIPNNQLNNTAMIMHESNAYRFNVSNMTIDGNKDNNSNTIHGIYLNDTSGDSYINFDNVRFISCTGHGFYSLNAVRGMFVNNCQASYNNGHGFYWGVGTTDCSIVNCNASLNKLNGYRFESGANKIQDCKAFLNGEVSELTPYTSRQAGFYNAGQRNTFVNCYSQENYGDGFYNVANDCIFSDIIGDNNGLYTVDGEPTPLPSGTDPYYSGIRLYNCERVIVSGNFANFRTTTLQTQAYGLKLENAREISGNINAISQKSGRANYDSNSKYSIIVNGFENSNQKYVEISHNYTNFTNNPLRVELCGSVVILTGRVKLDSNLSTEINMATVPADYRPQQHTPISVFIGPSNGNGNKFTGVGAGNVSPTSGGIFIRNDSSQTDALWVEVLGMWKAKNFQYN